MCVQFKLLPIWISSVCFTLSVLPCKIVQIDRIKETKVHVFVMLIIVLLPILFLCKIEQKLYKKHIFFQPWPITGGKSDELESGSRDLLLTGYDTLIFDLPHFSTSIFYKSGLSFSPFTGF